MSLSETASPIPEETLHIQNFAGITDATISLSRMNVFIGPQASGKSVCAKLIYYFREVASKFFMKKYAEESVESVVYESQALFKRYFPFKNLGDAPFRIVYMFGNYQLAVHRLKDTPLKLDFLISTNLTSMIEDRREASRGQAVKDAVDFSYGIKPSDVVENLKQVAMSDKVSWAKNNNAFIAGGRSFFSVLKNITFTLQSSGIKIDPFLLEFGSDYERAKSRYFEQAVSPIKQYPDVQKRIERILCGEYSMQGDNEYISHNDGRRVLLEDCSSGQQEALPLALILSSVGKSEHSSQHTTLFVEEPEAHLYPDAQREMVHLLCTALDLTSLESSSQCVITTHSPYILTALNNLMYGAKIAIEFPTRLSDVRTILGETDLIPPEYVRAYAYKDGTVKSIISEKTGLVVARELDGVSDKLAQEFEVLVEIAFEETEDE